MLPVVALIPVPGEGVPAGWGAGAAEKMLKLPARTPVGCVARPAIEPDGWAGAGGKALAFAAGACCAGAPAAAVFA